MGQTTRKGSDMTETTTRTIESAPSEQAEAFAERLFEAVLGAQEIQAAFLGDALGWYGALAEHGPLTSTELADSTGTHERYAREWLEHQAVTGYVTVETPHATPTRRRYGLPGAHAEVLTDEESLAHVLPFARFTCGVGKHIDRVVDAYRTGGGVSWGDLGADPREAQAAMNRPMFLNQLGHEYLRSVPDVDAVLRAGGRVADIGCGGGWSSIGIALAYPDATVEGFDVDAPSIEMARRNAVDAGVADRVRFAVADAAELRPDASFDLVVALECIHDLPHPVEVLDAMRRLAGEAGSVIVMDERVADEFTGADDPVERAMYGFSLMCCLPDGMAHAPTEATGTVMRAPTLTGYAQRAGFADVDVLPIEDDFFRFYRLVR